MQLFHLLAAATLAAATADYQVKMQVHYNATYDIKVGPESPRTGSICLDPSTFDRLGMEYPAEEYYFYLDYYPYPYVGGYAPIKADDYYSCLNCYQLHYGGKSAYFRAINTAKDGVDLGKKLFEELSGGKAAELKHFNATLGMVDNSFCLLSEQLLNDPLHGAYLSTHRPAPGE
ncbi:hypothetical protein ACHAPE_001153 [Trichoderma viride]